MIKAIIFDLDDTLFPEEDYVKSGFRAIADYFGDKNIFEKLYGLFKKDKRNVYQRAGFSEEECSKCIEIYRNHFPDIKLDLKIKELLSELKERGFLLGIITDGRPIGQRNKISALRLDELIDKIIVTDELGGIEFRKPNPKPFELMKEALKIDYNEMMYIGDNPAKDFFIRSIYPIHTVRVINSGMYEESDYFGDVKECLTIKNLYEILENL